MTGTQTFILGLASTIIAAASGYLLHRRSKVSDAATAQSGAASNHRAGTEQVIQGLNQVNEGLNKLLDQAQDTIKEDRVVIKEDREVIKLLEDRIKEFIATNDACKAENILLLSENARLRKKYGDNGDTPQPPNKGTK